ncbi:MAG: LytTR family DNA-binding domain-containing protein [Bacteroidota bacterium]
MTPKISLQKIAYFQAAQSYCLLVLGDGKVVVKARPIKHFSSILESDGWCRIHRSFMVNPDYVQYISEDRSTIYLQNGKQLPISRRLRKNVLKWRN